jgi:hypothetical protein
MQPLRIWLNALILAAVVALARAPYSWAENPVSPSDPEVVLRPDTERPAEQILPSPTPLPEQPSAYVLPAPGWPTVDFTQPDPLLDRPYAAPPGFFTNVEINVLWLHLHNRLGAPVLNAVTGALDQVQVGRTKLDPTVSPRFEVGCRLPDNWGTCSFGYGFLASQAREQSTTGPQDTVQALADKAGRLVCNMWDLTYGSREYSLDPLFNLRWGAGARLMYLFFDARGEIVHPGSLPGSVLAQSETNYVQCYGFWAYLDLERHIGPPGLAAFFRLEGSDFFARIHQSYAETVAGSPGLGPQSSGTGFANWVGPSILREIVGISYTLPRWNHSRILLGYQYEQFFQIGRLSPTSGVPDTRGSLDAHGLFLRGELNF